MLAATGKSDITSILTWGLVLIVAIVVLGVGIWWLRRWMFGGGEAESGELWSLHQLRQWRDNGQISQAEFERLRAEMIDAVRRAEARKGAKGGPEIEVDAAEFEVKREDEGGR